MGTYRFNDNVNDDKPAPAGQRGIGCILIILLPIISYSLATLLLDVSSDVRRLIRRIDPALLRTPSIPSLIRKLPVLGDIRLPAGLGAKLLLGLLILLALSGLIAVISAIIHKVVSPPRYSGVDAPPMKSKGKSRSR